MLKPAAIEGVVWALQGQFPARRIMADLSADRYADLPADSSVSPQEMREHRRSYLGFERLILFSVLHIALALVCLALAFLAYIPVLAFLLFIGGSLATIAGLVVYGNSHDA
jgi:hypothetical protein